MSTDGSPFAFAACSAKFANRSLLGCYGGLAISQFLTGITPPQNAAIDLIHFDGAGQLKGAYVGCWEDAIINRSFTGTYTVLADGTGSMKWVYTSGGGGESYDFVLVSAGQELFCLLTSEFPKAPFVATMVMKKQ
jgi:hypothetical protein